MEELGIECRVGHRPEDPQGGDRGSKEHDRRDARLVADVAGRELGFPTIWMPSSEQRDLRTLLRHRHQWVRLRSRVQHTLQSMALKPRSKARPLPMEPSGPGRTPGVASGSSRQRATEGTDDVVSRLAGIASIRARPAGE